MTCLPLFRKIRQNLLPLLSVYLFCCHPALSQQLATEEDFPEVDVATSADGRYSVFSENEFIEPPNIFFQSSKLYLHDSSNDTNLLVYTGAHFMLTGNSASNAYLGPEISANGKFIAFRMIENGYMELYRHNIDSGETIFVSADGNPSNMGGVHIGPDGRYLTYVRTSIVYLYDSLDGSLNVISNDDSCPSAPDLSADGRYIAYGNSCRKPELFLYDIDNRTNIKLDTGGVIVRSDQVIISENSRYVRFNAPGDVPGQIYDRTIGEIYPFGITAECIDTDGDGWGFNEFLGESCVVDQITQSACDYSDADLYGGWGWNDTTRESCAPLAETVDQVTSQIPEGCDYSNAALSNGWGWNDTTRESCAPLTETVDQVTSQVPVGCDYSNAALSNGWGWNETTRQSCAPL